MQGAGANGLGVISNFIIRGAGIIHVVIDGSPTLSEYQAAAIRIRDDSGPESDAGPAGAWICDLGRSDLRKATNLQLLKFCRFLAEINPERQKVAVLAAKTMHLAIEQFAREHHLDELMTFTSPDDAYRWIRKGTLPTQRVPAISLGSKRESSST